MLLLFCPGGTALSILVHVQYLGILQYNGVLWMDGDGQLWMDSTVVIYVRGSEKAMMPMMEVVVIKN